MDCLRASTSTESITPFIHSFPLKWNRCYSSGTWTLPSHASLFSGQSLIDHGVTRPGDELSRSIATLPRIAQESGYKTALFSENPYFSSQTGFGNHINDTYDDIDKKPFQSDFSPFSFVDKVGLDEGLSLTKEILSRPNRIRNLVNTGYTAYREFSSYEPSYPHNGNRVISRLISYLSYQTEPTLIVTNILEPHNPYHGKPPNTVEKRPVMELEALQSGDDNRTYLLTREQPPEKVSSVYGDWETLHRAQKDVYEEYVREADKLLKKLKHEQTEWFEDGLVVIVGDHGQLFGAEGMVGHQTSLHPLGINVPLAIDPPKDWRSTERAINDPVSIAGLGSALTDVMRGKIDTTSGLTEAIFKYSHEEYESVISCADGPVWPVTSLQEEDRYDESLIDKLSVRKVARIDNDYVYIYESRWNESQISVKSYQYSQSDRNLIRDREAPPVPNKVENWLTEPRSPVNDKSMDRDARLEALGYI